MGDTVSEFFMTGVNLLFNAIIIVAFGSIFALVFMLNNEISRQEGVNEQMKVCAEYNQYDGTHCYSQDVVSAVFAYRGYPEITLDLTPVGRGTYTWTRKSKPCEYTTTDVASLVPVERTVGGSKVGVVYDTDIAYDVNGAVSKITFKICTNAAACGHGG